MDRKDFIQQTANAARRAYDFSISSRKQGLMEIEDKIDADALKCGDIFELGIRFTLDGENIEKVDEILTNMISREKDENTRRFKTIQKEAVRCIQGRFNSFTLLNILFSFISDDEKNVARELLADNVFKEYFDSYCEV